MLIVCMQCGDVYVIVGIVGRGQLRGGAFGAHHRKASGFCEPEFGGQRCDGALAMGKKRTQYSKVDSFHFASLIPRMDVEGKKKGESVLISHAFLMGLSFSLNFSGLIKELCCYIKIL